ncbi:hypothetical protein [Clostridium beijerinckii]|uniref:hypothetical protein n=1 Tax=Clostridium beijerinckii TaxID=1520 RepID=UPI0014947460|nr:hypothetical protein [Clostridium beijerinckii]NOW05014.1 hypothetical protein [Clostridium beijerinckii]NYC01844.1 hypothetical protein [Clostridium beijerinckii]
MVSLDKVRVQLLDENTGAVLKKVNVLTSADAVTFADGQTFQQKLDSGLLKGSQGIQGPQGAAGIRGSQWYSGTAITGTSTSATVFTGSGITSALVNGQYFNTSTGNVYVCMVSGNASAAKWVYSICLKVDTGATGTAGPTGATGPQGPAGASIKVGTDYASGTQVKLFLKTI